jgi:glycogen debranching enzyme
MPEEMYFPDLGRAQKEIAWYTLDTLNHPLLAWGELTSFALTGNAERLTEVFPPLLKQYESMRELLMHANGLYVSDWAGMDNSPRNKYLGCALDMSCEMVLFAANLLEMMGLLEARGLMKPDEKLRLTLESQQAALKETINRLLCDSETGFYFDLKPDGTRAPIKTIAAYWALAAGVADKEQAERLVSWLENPSAFKRLHRVPVCAASEEGYDPRGGYWRGSVWAPTNTMVLYGLEKYGYDSLAREIALNHLDAVARVWEDTGTIWENYPPDSISSADADKKDFVGWSGMGPIRYLLRYAIGLVPDAPNNTLRWNLHRELLREGELGCGNFRFGDVETSVLVKSEGGKLFVSASSDREYTLQIAFGEILEQRRVKGLLEFVIPLPR